MGPIRRLAGGKGWLHFQASDTFFGFSVFGRPGSDDVRDLVRSLALELEPGVAPHRSLADTTGLERVDPVGFMLMSEYVLANRARLAAQVTQLAIVRPSGAVGATVAGFYAILDPPYPVKIFSDRQAALSWLGEDGRVDASLSNAIAEDAREAELLADVRAQIRGALGSATLGSVARRLATSSRTLQRRLQCAGTTFHQVLQSERLQHAEQLLEETDEPVTTIAWDAGFGSTSHFSAAFRRRTGMSPTEWRSRQRR